MLHKVKVLLGIYDQNDDEKILMLLQFTNLFVRQYCNLDQLTQDMEPVCIMVCCQLFRQFENYSKVSIGDVSMEFNTNDHFYNAILKKYRKVGFYHEK